MKIFEFRLKFHWSLFLRVQLKYSTIGSDNGLFLMVQLKYSTIDSDNGLALIRRQAIIWINDG